MVDFTWTKELSVGNGVLDAQHHKVLDMVNRVECAIRAKDGALLLTAFEQMKEAISVHFDTEESIASAINLPFLEHILLHDYVRNELSIMGSEFAKLYVQWSESVAEYYYFFLNEWLYNHLAEDVREIKPVLKRYPYDFGASIS
jgi:hemerythrin-like metal-binding protein